MESIHFPIKDKWVPNSMEQLVLLVETIIHRLRQGYLLFPLSCSSSFISSCSSCSSCSFSSFSSSSSSSSSSSCWFSLTSLGKAVVVHCNGGKGRSGTV